MSYLQQYLELTGDKRIKRSSDEIERGLDAEAAAKERMEAFEKLGKKPEVKKNSVKKPKQRRLGNKGKFTINLQPKPDTDPEFLEVLTGKEFTVELDEKFYSWFGTKLGMPYNGDSQRLIEHILDLGLGEIIVHINFPEDLEEHIRLTTFPNAKS